MELAAVPWELDVCVVAGAAAPEGWRKVGPVVDWLVWRGDGAVLLRCKPLYTPEDWRAQKILTEIIVKKGSPIHTSVLRPGI